MQRRRFLLALAGNSLLLWEAGCRALVRPAPGPLAPAAPASPIMGTVAPPPAAVQSGAPTPEGNMEQYHLALPLPLETTPIDHFYVTTYSSTVPDFDPSTWELSVTGLVDRTIKLKWDELRARPAIQVTRTLECIGNPVGGSLISNGTWKGVSLKALLEEAGSKPGAKFLIMDSTDDYYTSVPLELALNDGAILAYELNGSPLTASHGQPLRALLPGVYGQKQPKWITHIEVADHSEKGYWEKKGWSDTCIIEVNSRIDRPPDGSELTGKQGDSFTITGVAFSSAPGVARVEVSTDGGATWNEAVLTQAGPPDKNYVWTRWGYDWPLPASGEYRILARATDGAGSSQGDPSKSIFFGSFPNGTNAMHQVVVTVKSE